MPKVVAVVPARYASTRLPGKPLLNESGKFLIQHVVERVGRCARIDRVLVATDDERILKAVKSFGGEAVMTRPSHPNGTSRIAEAVRKMDCEIVLNVQGDEPEIEANHLDSLIVALGGAEMGTLATPFEDESERRKPERVKVVVDANGFALYFSRAPIPGLLHLGVYAYAKTFLEKYVELPPTPLEQAERLEQLRALENGHRIKVATVPGPAFGGIDTRADYDAFLERLSRTNTSSGKRSKQSV